MSLVRDWKYIPIQAFLYLPKEEEIKRGGGTTISRRIFESGEPYEELEKQKLKELNDSLSRKHVAVIPWFTDANKLRFLQAKKYDIEQTRKSIVEHCKWRSETFPITYTKELTTFLDSGAIYFCGRDQAFRPIVVIDIARFNLNDAQSQKLAFLSKIIATFFEFMIDQLFVEGQIENYVMLVSLNNEGVWSIGGLMKTILNFTTNTYRSRLYVAYIVNCPKTITMVWNTAKGLLSESTVRKVNFLNQGVPEPLFAHCNRDQIEVKFSGSKPDISGNFWPPLVLTEKHLYSSQKLISQAQYTQLWKQGKLNQRKVCKEIIERSPHVQSPQKEPSQIRQSKANIHYSARSIEGEQRPQNTNAHVQGDPLVIHYEHSPEMSRQRLAPVQTQPYPGTTPTLMAKKGLNSPKFAYQNLRESTERYVPPTEQEQYFHPAPMPPVHSSPSFQASQAPSSPSPMQPQPIHMPPLNTSNVVSPIKNPDTLSQTSFMRKNRVIDPQPQPQAQSHPRARETSQEVHDLETPSNENINYDKPKNYAVDNYAQELNPRKSATSNLDIPYDTDIHINQVKTIRTFFDLSTYKNMKRMYYEFI